jgi:hypothetical protein
VETLLMHCQQLLCQVKEELRPSGAISPAGVVEAVAVAVVALAGKTQMRKQMTHATENHLCSLVQTLRILRKACSRIVHSICEHQEPENTREQRFNIHSFLVDEARTYRVKIAEFSCVNFNRSCCMQQFHTSELSQLEEEIQQLDQQ